MKHDIIKTAVFPVILMMLASGWTYSGAQGKDFDWKEKMKSEKIAYLTIELSLTPEEAQVFWPVYNASWETREKYHSQVVKSYKALEKAIEEQKNDKEVNVLLDAYLEALDRKVGIEKEISEQYKQVLPSAKVAKLYVVEEKFRREQINKLHHQKGPGR